MKDNKTLDQMIVFTKTKKTMEIETAIPFIIYKYLVEGLSLVSIEIQLFDGKHHKGWFSKSILNFYSIDTNVEMKNKGSLKGFTSEALIQLKLDDNNYKSDVIINLLLKHLHV